MGDVVITWIAVVELVRMILYPKFPNRNENNITYLIQNYFSLNLFKQIQGFFFFLQVFDILNSIHYCILSSQGGGGGGRGGGLLHMTISAIKRGQCRLRVVDPLPTPLTRKKTSRKKWPNVLKIFFRVTHDGLIKRWSTCSL